MGGEVYVVGGAVRDALLGVEPRDFDLLVRELSLERLLSALERLPGDVKLTGKHFGIVRYRDQTGKVEVALPRRERSTGAGHRDFEVRVHPGISIEDDLARRDFTVNAMAVDLRDGRLVDPHGGLADLHAGLIRMLSRESLEDDPLRALRALVLHGRYLLELDPETQREMVLHAPAVQWLPIDRIREELDKIFESTHPHAAVRLAEQTGVLDYVIPDLVDIVGYDQNNLHHELDLWTHSLTVLERVSALTEDRDLRLAALMHDVGKPLSAWKDPETGHNHYYEKRLPGGSVLGADHADVSADLTAAWMRQLGYLSSRVTRVSAIVRLHMWAPFLTTRGARRFMARAERHVDDLLLLRDADAGAKMVDYVERSPERSLVAQVRSAHQAVSRADLCVDGHDLISMGLEPGARLGRVLDELLLEVVEDPSHNDRDRLLARARELI